jgi:hydroxymethylpyrimidine/phosphomethylpyrimidine kinase
VYAVALKKALTIAGSDASGGAGIEADLTTFHEYGVYGMAAITSIVTMDHPRRSRRHPCSENRDAGLQ